MRYALISDIHANLEALQAVLADIDRRGERDAPVDAVYHLGDLVGYSSSPNAVVDRLPIVGRPVEDDAAAERWDRTSVHGFTGTYGDYVTAKVAKVFSDLAAETTR